MLKQKDLEEILKSIKILDEKQLKNLAVKAAASGKALEEFVIEQKLITPQLLYESAANYFHLPYYDLKSKSIRQDILLLIPKTAAKTHQTVAFDGIGNELKVATLDPSDLEFFDFLAKKTRLDLKLHLTSPDGLEDALKQYHKSITAEFEDINVEMSKKNAAGVESLKDLAHDVPIVKIVDTFLDYAIAEKASDIHIEPGELDVTIRFRIDGILKKVMTLPKTTHDGIIARLKILANLKLDEHRLPQDGRFKIKGKDYQVSCRISLIPTFDGEKAVMRLLLDQAKQLTLEDLGFQQKPLEIVKDAISRPHGMILVTGPTGSGKTTTLYTLIGMLNRPEVNITTIEDPIEYRMPGVNQSQIQPKIGFTFAAGLRAFLRQDPNIIMVGEIRDLETADIAINAAMTGHLVLSSLHTNDAITAIPRLIDMNIPTFLIASTLNLIIAQRLVRKICRNCIESYNLEHKVIGEMEKSFNIPRLEKLLAEQGYLGQKQTLKNVLFYRGKGCSQCDNTGYRGRVGIYEVLENDETISQLILAKADRNELTAAATKEGMMTMFQDAFLKAKNGLTTIEEILRVAKE